jgi:DNA mismatch repair protein MutS2
VAIIDQFRRRGATVIATSHYDALKTYASTTDGVAGAAFGFNPETFTPTYALVYGSPGRSLALEMAARLGLNPSVIAAARQNLSEREAQLAEHIAKIDRDIRELEHEHRLAARERQTLEADELRMRQREDLLRNKEETFRQRLHEEVDAKVREARREIDDVIAQLKKKAETYAADLHRSALLLSKKKEESDVAVDVTFPPPRLIIFGAVDIARELCSLARVSGWRPYVIDPRGSASP